MIILCDIDDTITNFSHVLISRLNAKYNTSYTVSDITSWDWIKNHFDTPWEVTDDISFWNEVRVMPDAKSVIEDLIVYGHKVRFVTSSFFNNTLGYKISSTIAQFDPDLVSYHNAIVCQDKQLIRGDVRIDDGVHNFSENSINLLYNQPWNQSFSPPCDFIRVNNWNKIRAVLLNK